MNPTDALKSLVAAVKAVTVPKHCLIHQSSKWCEHNGGVLGATGYEAPRAHLDENLRQATIDAENVLQPPCTNCGGVGEVISGMFMDWVGCPPCGGSGKALRLVSAESVTSEYVNDR